MHILTGSGYANFQSSAASSANKMTSDQVHVSDSSTGASICCLRSEFDYGSKLFVVSRIKGIALFPDGVHDLHKHPVGVSIHENARLGLERTQSLTKAQLDFPSSQPECQVRYCQLRR